MPMIRYLPRFRKAYRAFDELAAREGWSRGEIESYQLDRLNALWDHAIRHVPYYRQMAEARRLPERFASLPEFQGTVPTLGRDEIAQRSATLLSNRAQRGKWKVTSGSTGTPLAAYWGQEAHQEMLRAKYRFQLSWGIDIFDRTAFLWGQTRAYSRTLSSYRAVLAESCQDWLRNRLRLSAFNLNAEDLRNYLTRMQSFRPALLYGYSSATYLLACEAQQLGVSIDSLRLAILSAEPVFPAHRAQIEKALRVPVVAEYGSVECGFLAGEGPDRTLRVREDQVILETVPREDGRYDVVVTVLNNPSFPLIRYAIGDITDRPLELADEGFAILHSVSGRQYDHLLTRSGRRIHAFMLDDLFEPEPALRRWRVHQDRDGAVAITVERRDTDAKLDVARLESQVRGLMDGFPVQIEVVKALPPSTSAKHRRVTSHLASSWAPAQ